MCFTAFSASDFKLAFRTWSVQRDFVSVDFVCQVVPQREVRKHHQLVTHFLVQPDLLPFGWTPRSDCGVDGDEVAWKESPTRLDVPDCVSGVSVGLVAPVWFCGCSRREVSDDCAATNNDAARNVTPSNTNLLIRILSFPQSLL